MIVLRLTLPELDLLRQRLAGQSDDAAATLLAKLDARRQEATSQRTCPVCGNAFTQLESGRSGQYCSAACKQKAYRQRRDRALRSSPNAYLDS